MRALECEEPISLQVELKDDAAEYNLIMLSHVTFPACLLLLLPRRR